MREKAKDTVSSTCGAHPFNTAITAGIYPGTERLEVCYFVRRLVYFYINQSFPFSQARPSPQGMEVSMSNIFASTLIWLSSNQQVLEAVTAASNSFLHTIIQFCNSVTSFMSSFGKRTEAGTVYSRKLSKFIAGLAVMTFACRF